MAADRVIIEEMVLRLPGLSANAAQEISAQIAQRVGAGLAAALPKRSLGALDLRLKVRPGAEPHEMVDAVSRAVLEAILQ